MNRSAGHRLGALEIGQKRAETVLGAPNLGWMTNEPGPKPNVGLAIGLARRPVLQGEGEDEDEDDDEHENEVHGQGETLPAPRHGYAFWFATIFRQAGLSE